MFLVCLLALRSLVLQAWKDFLLLGRGEFYQCFLEECRPLFAVPPGTNAVHGRRQHA